MPVKAKLVEIQLDHIDPNPHRLMLTYPLVESKLELLKGSIRDVGFWEGVIGRQHGDHVQLAFGHHRIEAARQELGKKAKVPIIVRPISDADMLRFMARENMADYRADFLVMLGTWEAGVKHFEHNPTSGSTRTSVAVIARFLGWKERSDIAEACSNALKLIQAGHVKREEFTGMPPTLAREFCQTARNNVKRAADMLPEYVDKQTAIVHEALAVTAAKIRSGEIGVRDIKAQSYIAQHDIEHREKRDMRSVEAFVREITHRVSEILHDDSLQSKLKELAKVVFDLEGETQLAAIDLLCQHLAALEQRSAKWRVKLQPKKGNVIDIQTARSKQDV